MRELLRLQEAIERQRSRVNAMVEDMLPILEEDWQHFFVRNAGKTGAFLWKRASFWYAKTPEFRIAFFLNMG